MRRWIRISSLPLLSLLLTACPGESPSAAPDGSAPDGSPEAATSSTPIFVDRAQEFGVQFTHFNGMSGEFYIPEVTGTGVGMLDYDGDGDLDLYLVQGRMLGPGKSRTDALYPHPDDGPLVDRLLRNDLGDSGTVRFTDVTEASGLLDFGDGYGMGVVTGDYDGDGRVDLYVTNLEGNRLLRNLGDGRFEDATSSAGAEDVRWSVPAVFFDYDRDGHLDLYVGNYLDFGYDNHKTCLSVTGARDYCGPSAYRGEPDRLLHNLGDGTFEDVTRGAGLATAYGPALGAVAADYDQNGWPDVYVANDGKANQLWLNQRDGRFQDAGILAGAAVNASGFPEASMGVDAADFDGDGDVDLFMAHITGETNTLFTNDGSALFEDRSILSGLGPASKWATAFGAGAFDFDNDGWLDVLTVNGAVRTIEEQARNQVPYPLRQPNQLFRNQGEGRFEDVSDRAGAEFLADEVSRGAAFGDVDNDGDTDVLVLNSNGPIQLLINQVGQDNPWLGLRLTTGEPSRDALGAQAALLGPDDSSWPNPLGRRVRTDGSFASANDPRVLFGLGGRVGEGGQPAAGYTVRVSWPDGSEETWSGLSPGRYTTLHQGRGPEESSR